MKIAVCLSGQFRTFDYCYDSILNYFGDVDYFCHTWNYNDFKEKKPNSVLETRQEIVDETEIAKKLEILNPRGVQIQGNDVIKENFLWSSLFYSQMAANNLKIQYEIDNNFRYDIVIKSRYDLIFKLNSKFKVNQYANTSNYFKNHDLFVLHQERAPEGFYMINISDVIYYGSSTAMDIMANLYWYAKEKNKQTSKFEDNYNLIPGCIISDYVSDHNLRFIYDHNLQELVYRRSAEPLDYRVDYDKIVEKHFEIYQ